MTPEIRKRLTTLFHVLTRDHLPWGTLHKLIDEHALVGDGEHVYASDAGRALAEAAIGRLIGPQTSEQLEQYGVVETDLAAGSRVFTCTECPQLGEMRRGQAGVVARIENGFALVEHTDKRRIVYDVDQLLTVEGLAGRIFRHRDGSTCGLVSVNTNTCAVRWAGDDYENSMGLDNFTNGNFALLPALADVEREPASTSMLHTSLPSQPRHAALPRGVSEPDWSKLCAAVGLIESVDIDDIVEVINERRNEEWYAVETLAAYCAEADPGKLSLRNVISMLESEVLRVGKRKQNQTPGNGASITVDTSICSFDDAMRQALVLAQTHIRVRLRHGCATVDVSSFDLPATLRDRWQREADHVQATRRRRGDDGRSRIAHDLRDAGFTSAGWSDSTSEIAGITLSNADASALLTSGVRLRDGKAVSS